MQTKHKFPMEKIYKGFVVHIRIQSEVTSRWKESPDIQTCPKGSISPGLQNARSSRTATAHARPPRARYLFLLRESRRGDRRTCVGEIREYPCDRARLPLAGAAAAPRWPSVLLTRGVYDWHCNAGRSFCPPGARTPTPWPLRAGMHGRNGASLHADLLLHCASAMHAHTPDLALALAGSNHLKF